MGAAKLLSFLIFNGVEVLVHLGIVAFAILAACRHRLIGIWLLAAAALLSFLQLVVWVIGFAPINGAGHNDIRQFMGAVTLLRYSAGILALCGWCSLAFTRRRPAAQQISCSQTHVPLETDPDRTIRSP